MTYEILPIHEILEPDMDVRLNRGCIGRNNQKGLDVRDILCDKLRHQSFLL